MPSFYYAQWRRKKRNQEEDEVVITLHILDHNNTSYELNKEFSEGLNNYTLQDSILDGSGAIYALL